MPARRRRTTSNARARRARRRTLGTTSISHLTPGEVRHLLRVAYSDRSLAKTPADHQSYLFVRGAVAFRFARLEPRVQELFLKWEYLLAERQLKILDKVVGEVDRSALLRRLRARPELLSRLSHRVTGTTVEVVVHALDEAYAFVRDDLQPRNDELRGLGPWLAVDLVRFFFHFSSVGLGSLNGAVRFSFLPPGQPQGFVFSPQPGESSGAQDARHKQEWKAFQAGQPNREPNRFGLSDKAFERLARYADWYCSQFIARASVRRAARHHQPRGDARSAVKYGIERVASLLDLAPTPRFKAPLAK